MSNAISLIGKRFGKAIVIREAENHISKSGRSDRASVCVCDCGKEFTARNDCLRYGKTLSCGCLQTKHGHGARKGRSRTYSIWASMLQRCKNPKDAGWIYYGGRGIQVCKRWESFENFLKDVGEIPVGKTLGRINNNGNYEPGNCEFQTYTQQNQNTRRNRVLTVFGKTACLTELCRQMGVDYDLIYGRLRWGWDVEKAFSTPSRALRLQ